MIKALKLLVSETRLRFFFIDGLDGFNGDTLELAKMVIEISSAPNVKVCTASRPWLAFEESFESRPRLRVENLTRSDIELFVSEKLNASTRFAQLQRQDPQNAQLLIGEVTGKAYCVFLWVYLVVRSLLDGLRDGDSISDLQKRISLLPSDLEELFKKILDRLDPYYFEQASKLFQMMPAAAPRSLTVLCISFADDDLGAALRARTQPLTSGELDSRAESVRRRLNSRSKGLLEATPTKDHPARAQVQYLHRTVKDFLPRHEIWEYILSGTNDSFNANVMLCGAYLLHIKTMPQNNMSAAPLWDSVRGCIDQTRRAEEYLGLKQIQVLDEMDKAACHTLGTFWIDTQCQAGPPLSYHEYETWGECYPCSSFFDFAFRNKLYAYVDYKLAHSVPVTRFIHGRSLLATAVRRKDFRMIKLLFQHRAKPNQQDHLSKLTAWHHLLHMVDNFYSDRPEDWYNSVDLFVEHGAELRIKHDGGTPFHVIETAFGGWDFDKMVKMLGKLEKVWKKSHSHSQIPPRFRSFRISVASPISISRNYQQGCAYPNSQPHWVYPEGAPMLLFNTYR